MAPGKMLLIHLLTSPVNSALGKGILRLVRGERGKTNPARKENLGVGFHFCWTPGGPRADRCISHSHAVIQGCLCQASSIATRDQKHHHGT